MGRSLEERPCCPNFLSPFGCRRWLVGPSCSRQGIGSSLRSAYQSLLDPDGVSAFHTSEIRSGWMPSLLRDGGVQTADKSATAATYRFPAASPIPQRRIPSPGLSVTKHHRGFTCVHPADLSLACSSRMEREPLSVNPELRTPRLLATHVGAGTGPWTPARNYTINIDPPNGEFTRNVQLRVARSHRSRRNRLQLPGSCHPDHQTDGAEAVHFQCANIRGYRWTIPRQHRNAFVFARSRLYLFRIQRIK